MAIFSTAMVIELMVWLLNCCVVIKLTKKKMQKWPDNLTDENLVSPPIFSFPKPFSHRNEFKSMSVKKRKRGRRRRQQQSNRSKFCLLYIQIAELSDRTQPSGRIINSILGNFHSSSQSDGGQKTARLDKYKYYVSFFPRFQETRKLSFKTSDCVHLGCH